MTSMSRQFLEPPQPEVDHRRDQRRHGRHDPHPHGVLRPSRDAVGVRAAPQPPPFTRNRPRRFTERLQMPRAPATLNPHPFIRVDGYGPSDPRRRPVPADTRGERDGGAGQGVLAAGARRGGDPAGRRAGPGTRRGPRAHPALGGEPRHRDARLPRRRARPTSTTRCGRRSRRATSPARSSTATSTSGSWRAGRPTWSVARSSASTRTRRPTWCPRSAVTVVPDDVPAAPGGARGHRGDGRQRAVGRRAAGGRPGRRRGGGHGRAAAWRGCWPASRVSEVTVVDVDPGAPAWSRGPRGRLRAARRTPRADATSWCTRAPRRRAPAVARPARARGHGRRAELVRRRRGAACRWAAPSTRAAVDPGQPGRARLPARRGTPSTADRLGLALDLLRDPAFDALLTGASPFDDLPDVLPRLADGTLPALCHTITYGEG